MSLGQYVTHVISFSGRMMHRVMRCKYIRPIDDPRLVFYHGLGDGAAPCLRYVRDEIPPEIFRRHMAHLTDTYDVVSLDDVVDFIESPSRRLQRPLSSVSFDDGLASLYHLALPILREFRIPATVFVNTAVVDNVDLTWVHLANWLMAAHGCERVSALLNHHKPEHVPSPPSGGQAILLWYKNNFQANQDAGVLDRVCDELALDRHRIARDEKMYLTWQQITEMENHGITFASHSHSHTPLAQLTNNECLSHEIRDAREILARRAKNIDYIAFPFGTIAEYGRRAIEYSLKIGHKYVLEVGDGVNDRERARRTKLMSRVGLSPVSGNPAHLCSAIETTPWLKQWLRRPTR